MKPENLRKITELRHELHREPELSLREAETGKKLRKFLRENTSFEIVERDGWFYAVKKVTEPETAGTSDETVQARGTSPKSGMEPVAGSIAFRADMDALPIEEGLDLPYASIHPGVSHKCGHDGHCAALCGLALELEQMSDEAKDLEQTSSRSQEPDQISYQPEDHPAPYRNIYLIFQKAEEIGCGGFAGAELLREEGIREVYAFHNFSGYPEGAVVYRRGLTQPASEGLTILFHGKQSHASAPEEGINPSGVIAETVRFIEELQRETEQFGEPQSTAPQIGEPEDQQAQPRRGMALCTIVGLNAGSGDFGISAGEGSLKVTLRAEEEAVMREMERRICCFATERATERGIRTEFEVRDYFPETRNSEEGIDRVLCAAEALQVPAVEMPQIWRASEDFGYYLKACPGAMFYVGNGRDWPALHTTEYDFNDRILERAVDLFAKIARRP